MKRFSLKGIIMIMTVAWMTAMVTSCTDEDDGPYMYLDNTVWQCTSDNGNEFFGYQFAFDGDGTLYIGNEYAMWEQSGQYLSISFANGQYIQGSFFVNGNATATFYYTWYDDWGVLDDGVQYCATFTLLRGGGPGPYPYA